MKINGKNSTVIDLFAGAGGLSLGAYRAGFEVVAAVENDHNAVRTHIKNFPSTVHLERDVASMTGKELLDAAALEKGELCGLIGGPPCQGFSNIGIRDKNDVRNRLFTHFFRLVDETEPDFFLAENVPGILSDKYNEIRKEAFNIVSGSYSLLSPLKIKASDYGVPTSRTRIFFIGFKKETIDLENAEAALTALPSVPEVRVKNALRGLPRKISPEWLEEEDGWRKTYAMPNNSYTRKIIGEIPEGVGHKDSVDRYLKTGKVSGCLGTRHSPEISARYAAVKPGGTDTVSKSPRLKPSGFCPTLRAGTGSDKGSFQAVRPIHPSQGRVITPREAARLQGFPDWFVFDKTKWHSFRQIGNSVSPIVAEYLLKKIHNVLEHPYKASFAV